MVSNILVIKENNQQHFDFAVHLTCFP